MKSFVRPLIVVVVGSVVCIAWVQVETTPLQWIRANAIRLTNVEAGRGFADMQPLKQVIGSARIVSLGEATHGTREFFQLKHRMLEFLASEMGFTIFAIEANMPEVYGLNDYVLNGKGDPAQLLKGLYFWTWDTEEVLEMIQWMRAFNASGKGPVQFTGFDGQFPAVALQISEGFITRYDPPYLATMKLVSSAATEALGGVVRGQSVAPGQPAEAVIAQTGSAIGQLISAMAHLESGRVGYRAAGASEQEVDWALQNVRIVLQSLQAQTIVGSRDRNMADNVKWILDRNPNAKMVLWAHNVHVAADGGPTMGTALRRMFGTTMVVFGFAFNQGSFLALRQFGQFGGGVTTFSVPPLAASSLDATLASAGIPVFALDLRAAPLWFKLPRLSRQIGAGYTEGVPDDYNMPLIAPMAFDVLLFVESTTAARQNR